MPSIGDIGDRIDLVIRQGATFGPHQVTMANPDASPVNLTGAVVEASLTELDAAAAEAAVFTVAMTDPAAGQFEFWLSATITAGLRAGRSLTDRSGAYGWSMQITYADGTVRPLYWGAAQVVAG